MSGCYGVSIEGSKSISKFYGISVEDGPTISDFYSISIEGATPLSEFRSISIEGASLLSELYGISIEDSAALSECYGISIEETPPLSVFHGISVEDHSNLRIFVKDERGNAVNGESILITIDDTSESEVVNGVIGHTVAEGAQIAISFIDSDQYIKTESTYSFTHSGVTIEEIIINVRKVYYYHTLAKKGISRSEESDRAKLKNEE